MTLISFLLDKISRYILVILTALLLGYTALLQANETVESQGGTPLRETTGYKSLESEAEKLYTSSEFESTLVASESTSGEIESRESEEAFLPEATRQDVETTISNGYEQGNSVLDNQKHNNKHPLEGNAKITQPSKQQADMSRFQNISEQLFDIEVEEAETVAESNADKVNTTQRSVTLETGSTDLTQKNKQESLPKGLVSGKQSKPIKKSITKPGVEELRNNIEQAVKNNSAFSESIVTKIPIEGQIEGQLVQPGSKLKLKDEYVIGIGDQVQVSVWRNPDLSISVPVRPDGRISTPLVGDVVAAGLTPEKLADFIKGKLSVYVRDPHVTVVLVGLNSHEYLSRVRITGAISRPMTIPHREGMTVLDLVLEAGGVTEFASPNRAILYRQVNQKANNAVDVIAAKDMVVERGLGDKAVEVNQVESKRIKVRLKDILHKGNLKTNVVLRPGDILTIPERFF